ncbi:MAG: hypothetical protein JWQ49_4474 [Edaphobacter sp.]|nr:hypothetical protein [Edaphobacter sp.]
MANPFKQVNHSQESSSRSVSCDLHRVHPCKKKRRLDDRNSLAMPISAMVRIGRGSIWGIPHQSRRDI